MSIAMQYSAPAPSDYFTSGQHFLETSTLSPKTTRTTTNGDFNVYFLKQQTRLLLNYGEHNPSHVQRHALLSQIYHNSISSLYFFPFPRGLQHKRKLYIPYCQLKTLMKKLPASSSSYFFILLYIPYKLSEQTTQRKHTHARYNFSSLKRKKTTNKQIFLSC